MSMLIILLTAAASCWAWGLYVEHLRRKLVVANSLLLDLRVALRERDAAEVEQKQSLFQVGYRLAQPKMKPRKGPRRGSRSGLIASARDVGLSDMRSIDERHGRALARTARESGNSE